MRTTTTRTFGRGAIIPAALLCMMVMILGGCACSGQGMVEDLKSILPQSQAGGPMQVAAAKEVGYFDFRAYDRDGNLLWQDLDRPNGLADEGESIFLDCVLRATSCPTTFYLRLYNDTPAETDTLADLAGEPSTNGYTKQQLTRDATGWPTLALDTGDFQATSATKTFAASGGSWGPVTYCVLATSSDNTGKLVSYVALSQSRTLADGESLQVTYKLKLQ